MGSTKLELSTKNSATLLGFWRHWRKVIKTSEYWHTNWDPYHTVLEVIEVGEKRWTNSPKIIYPVWFSGTKCTNAQKKAQHPLELRISWNILMHNLSHNNTNGSITRTMFRSPNKHTYLHNILFLMPSLMQTKITFFSTNLRFYGSFNCYGIKTEVKLLLKPDCRLNLLISLVLTL